MRSFSYIFIRDVCTRWMHRRCICMVQRRNRAHSRCVVVALHKRASGTLEPGEVWVVSFFYRWPISRLECKETAREMGAAGEKREQQECGWIDCDINDRFKKLLTAELPLDELHPEIPRHGSMKLKQARNRPAQRCILYHVVPFVLITDKILSILPTLTFYLSRFAEFYFEIIFHTNK